MTVRPGASRRLAGMVLCVLAAAACVEPRAPRAQVELAVSPSPALPGLQERDDGDLLTRRTLGELGSFTEWLERHDVQGFVGEVGWPGDSSGDAAAWNALAHRWYEAADRADLWVSAWATGTRWGAYPLAAYRTAQAPQPDGELGLPGPQAEVLEQHLGTDQMLRGIAVAGGSFGDTAPGFSDTDPGTFGIDYSYPGRQAFEYLAGRGFAFVRIDFRWERVQPRRFAALDEAELQRLRTVADEAAAAGLQVVLDLHNYGEYMEGSGRRPARRTVGSTELPTAALVDLWERMSNAFADHPGILAYGLMNEPHDLQVRATPTPHVWHTFDDGTQGWTGPVTPERARVRTGDGALRVSWPADAESLFVSNNDEGRKDCAINGSTLSAWLYLPADAPAGLWTASLQVQGPTYGYHAGPHQPLRPGRWTAVNVTPPPSLLGACRAFALYFSGPTGAPAELYADDVTQEGRLLPAQVWEATSQAVVTGLRERGDDTLLMVSGHGWSAVQTWTAQHPDAWIDDPRRNIRYEAHHYWDHGRRSDYRSYVEELAQAEAAG